MISFYGTYFACLSHSTIMMKHIKGEKDKLVKPNWQFYGKHFIYVEMVLYFIKKMEILELPLDV